jgi:hypothetical protein
MTSFSILFARQKGDLSDLVRGALHIDALGDGAASWSARPARTTRSATTSAR